MGWKSVTNFAWAFLRSMVNNVFFHLAGALLCCRMPLKRLRNSTKNSSGTCWKKFCCWFKGFNANRWILCDPKGFDRSECRIFWSSHFSHCVFHTRTPNCILQWSTQNGCCISPTSPVSGPASSQHARYVTRICKSSRVWVIQANVSQASTTPTTGLRRGFVPHFVFTSLLIQRLSHFWNRGFSHFQFVQTAIAETRIEVCLGPFSLRMTRLTNFTWPSLWGSKVPVILVGTCSFDKSWTLFPTDDFFFGNNQNVIYINDHPKTVPRENTRISSRSLHFHWFTN